MIFRLLICHWRDLSIACCENLPPQVLNLRTGELYVLRAA